MLTLAYLRPEGGQSIWSKRRQGFQPCLKLVFENYPFSYAHIIVCVSYSVSVVSQVGKAFYCDSIVCRHLIYKTVWTLQQSRDHQTHPMRAIADDVTFSLNVSGVECSLLLRHGSGHSQSFAPCLCTCRCHRHAPLLLFSFTLPSAASIRGRPLNGVWRLFEQIRLYLNCNYKRLRCKLRAWKRKSIKKTGQYMTFTQM